MAQIWTLRSAVPDGRILRQNGGSARGYHESFARLAILTTAAQTTPRSYFMHRQPSA